jgi:hypothetical protein
MRDGREVLQGLRPSQPLGLMATPRVLLVGGNSQVAAMFNEHLHHGSRYEVASVAYCDHALAMLQRGQIDVALILSLRVPWTMWPSSYSPEWRADLHERHPAPLEFACAS